MMNLEGIRPASEEDLPAIVALFARVYPDAALSLARVGQHLRRILIEHPWESEQWPSLAYDDRNGRLVGFLGVLPRPMVAGGRPIVMAVSHHLMVDPDHRATLAGLRLLKTFLSGSQDLSICESAADVRKLWHAVGGSTSLLQSPRWTRPLGPLRYLGSLLETRGRLQMVVHGLSPLCRAIDRLATTMQASPYHLSTGDWTVETIGPERLVDYIRGFSEGCYLRPRYDERSLIWLFGVLVAKRTFGTLEARLVRHLKGQVLGYYVYFAKRGGVGEVLQLGGRADAMRDVFSAMAVEAWQHGVLALSGRLDPSYLSEMSGPTTFKHTGNWLLIHTSDPTLERAIYKGDAFLTRLESEWWLPFHE